MNIQIDVTSVRPNVSQLWIMSSRIVEETHASTSLKCNALENSCNREHYSSLLLCVIQRWFNLHSFIMSQTQKVTFNSIIFIVYLIIKLCSDHSSFLLCHLHSSLTIFAQLVHTDWLTDLLYGVGSRFCSISCSVRENPHEQRNAKCEFMRSGRPLTRALCVVTEGS